MKSNLIEILRGPWDLGHGANLQPRDLYAFAYLTTGLLITAIIICATAALTSTTDSLQGSRLYANIALRASSWEATNYSLIPVSVVIATESFIQYYHRHRK